MSKHTTSDTPPSIPPGYKLTDVGVIPEEWGVRRLGDEDIVCRIGSGITPTGGNRIYKQSGHPFVRSQNVGWGTLLLDELVFIDEQTHNTFQASEIAEGDVLLNITGASIGRCAVANTIIAQGNVNQHVCEIRPNFAKLNPYFLSNFLLTVCGQQQIDNFQAGGNRQGLNYYQIRKFLIPLPPLPEQRAIAAVLSDVDELLRALDTLIAKKRAIKQATMQQLLTGATRLPGFSGEWETKRLGEVVNVRYGKRQTEVQSESGIYPILATGGVIGMATAYLWDKPSILIGRKGTIDQPIYISTPFWVIDTAFYTEIKDTVDTKFIFYCLCTWKWYSLNEASGVPSLNSSNIERQQFCCPPLPEQRAIAAVLTDMDEEIAALEREREKTQAIKQGMMQQLLTGRVRLVRTGGEEQ